MITVLLILIAYVLGSIPNALWVGKTFKNIDVREHGSKNTGSTNAARVLGAKLGIFTLILDILKGALPTYLGIVLGANLLTRITGIDKLDIIVIGMAAILGHTFSLFLKFKGGKAVATTLGVFLVLVPYAILILLVVFFVIFGLTKYVSLASIVSAVALPITVYLTTRHIPLTILGIIIGLLVIIRHKENIKRLINGTESKLSFSKDKKDKK
ncbi:MAG: glycerol-3-phosphate 1-O-acyltransferase PlsY [Leptotrichiaceae bacterium]|jgi:acyl phosphate:glycerol-3-phosphate acyltransferase|nr:glycerol-3-phosphate 1-O-acyltransferase PlsY [Leptotrichiaceae bacterium]MBP7026430.1 glycerol-3-phosphate 1-O-acyltransferase PlsY [Leptotrichiaceae bacterium]MBP8636488.1 glycerol-3-phosphate 1-O-acyltransferase PlsY [Leptotrichiaceae bacterium]MBP9538165.1 glycerol-3-phosphate 1-O-acyltransferase PlsY [Leptotrichiaceae bacterium]MBP9875346.1 glycerol-3-phosphate 1-O-acyltransferase PlsY [Leptotrichiaceae bacterium]